MQEKKLHVLNLGLMGFYDSVKMQNVEVVHVDWKPSAQGSQELLDMIDFIRQSQEKL